MFKETHPWVSLSYPKQYMNFEDTVKLPAIDKSSFVLKSLTLKQGIWLLIERTILK